MPFQIKSFNMVQWVMMFIELQSRLQYLGFYTGKIDGVFGWRTYWALRNFQYEFGMEIDGLAGQKRKKKLVKASKYNEQHVKEGINKGKKFTHYGGTDLNKQKAPEKQAPAKQNKKRKHQPNRNQQRKSHNKMQHLLLKGRLQRMFQMDFHKMISS